MVLKGGSMINAQRRAETETATFIYVFISSRFTYSTIFEREIAFLFKYINLELYYTSSFPAACLRLKKG